MHTLTSGDAAAKLYLLRESLAMLERHTSTWSFFICGSLAAQDQYSESAAELIEYITQELVTPSHPDDRFGLSVELYLTRLDLIPSAATHQADLIGNLARDAWLRRMIAELEQHLASETTEPLCAA